jgi:HK97 family phage prohead protease
MSDTITTRRGIVESGTQAKGYAYRAEGVAVQMRAAGDGEATISAYAAVWNRYSQNLGGFVERIDPDAFTESLVDDDQIASYNHDYAALLGRRSSGTLIVEADAFGLRYDIPFDGADPDHVRVKRKIERGDLRGSSFTMRVAADGEDLDYTDEGTLLVTVKRASIVEVAPVVWPAYLSTEDDGAAVALRSLMERHPDRSAEVLERMTDPVVRAALLDSTAGGPTAERGLSLGWARLRLAELNA